ncbi:hypothetical protein BUALT_Bualt11G0065800 [Buddleja alternifolia]|uniref:Uncharacterized protein n=1 Tax=Buddleja alternifolia TaxID=168488 RepID=A0AAV6WTU6_9LAMI|nr:hypothetical protein BUALT_Bualt11G0065800 [Buddleja alternifolia]
MMRNRRYELLIETIPRRSRGFRNFLPPHTCESPEERRLWTGLLPPPPPLPPLPGDIADVLGEVSIFTAAGEPVKFKDLWDQEKGVAVVALMRHFGCICCWELASALRDSKERFDSAGVKLIAVGVGTPNKAQILAERLPFPLDSLYADPDRKVKLFSRGESLKKAYKNYTIKATPDDKSGVLQQGGMFVFKGKQLLYARRDEGTGDHAPLDDIFDICCKVPRV